MVEVFAGGLYGVHYVVRRKASTMGSGNTDQQPSHQRELRNQRCKFACRGMNSTAIPVIEAERKPAAQDGIDEVIFENVRMPVEKRRKVAIVGGLVSSGQGLQGGVRAMSDPRFESIDALNKTAGDD